MCFVMKTRQDNDVTDYASAFYAKMILNYCDWLDRVLFVTKTRHNNDMNDRISMMYAKNDSKLSWSIESGVVCDENQIRQLHDESFSCDLWQNQTDKTMMWPIV